MILFDNFFSSETSSNIVNIMYLSLLRDINKIGTYSWGSTVLSHYIVCVKSHIRVLVCFILALFCSKHEVGRECCH